MHLKFVHSNPNHGMRLIFSRLMTIFLIFKKFLKNFYLWNGVTEHIGASHISFNLAIFLQKWNAAVVNSIDNVLGTRAWSWGAALWRVGGRSGRHFFGCWFGCWVFGGCIWNKLKKTATALVGGRFWHILRYDFSVSSKEIERERFRWYRRWYQKNFTNVLFCQMIKKFACKNHARFSVVDMLAEKIIKCFSGVQSDSCALW